MNHEPKFYAMPHGATPQAYAVLADLDAILWRNSTGSTGALPTPPAYVAPIAAALRSGDVCRATHWTPSAFHRQEAGSHYSKMAVQPAHFIMANGIPWAEGSAIQYIARWREKGGVQDIRKAIHTLELLLEAETAKGAK